ncbi:MAG: histidine kinase, partial [Isosphaeraceae bacterium]
PWYAVYVQTPSEDLTRIDAATQRVLSKTLELAQQLGGIPMTFRGPDVASTMWAFAQEYAIKVIVIGKSRQPWYRRLTRTSIHERLMKITNDIDIYVIDV